jgi:hypothetical protein
VKAPYDLVTLTCALVYIPLCLYLIALWCFALIRTGFAFCYIFVFAYALLLVLSVINATLHYDPFMGARLLGREGWTIVYYIFICAQPMNDLITIVGFTMLVTWLLKTRSSSSDAKV